MSLTGRLRRLLALIRLSLTRTYIRATQTAPGRTWLSVGGVALAVGLMVVVTGIGVGIATQSTVYGDNVDYWITPETDGSSSVLVNTDGPRFGSVHPTAVELSDREAVTYASPILTQPVQIQAGGGQTENILAVGIVKSSEFSSVADVTTTGLTPGDPYFRSGTWTGEVTLSAGAAQLLGAKSGDKLKIVRPAGAADRNFTAVTVGAGNTTSSQFPIAVMQLSELQAITGADAADEADQIVVASTDPTIESSLATVYPQSSVSTRAGLTAQAVLDEQLPLALSVTAAIIAIVIGTLFVMTTTGLAVASDRDQISTLAAIGISRSTRFRLLAVEILTITLVGGVVGVGLGAIGIQLANIAAQRTVTTGAVASAEPVVLAFGVVIAGVIGLLVLPYLTVLLRRIGTATEVGQ